MANNEENRDIRSRQGINTIIVNSARNMHMKTVNARIPQKSTPQPLSQQQNPQWNNFMVNRGTQNTSTIHQRFKSPLAPRTQSTRHVCNNPNNPPCAHCGTTIIPSPKAFMPLEDNPEIIINNWKISTKKKPILNSVELEDWENNKLKGLALPEMIFGNNAITIQNIEKDWTLQFNTLDALKMVKLEDSGIRVSYSNKWLDAKKNNATKNSNQKSDIDESSLKIVHNYDWTYTTEYKGTIKQNSKDSVEYNFQRDDEVQLPIDKLSRSDKILFFDDMILFEDELADNGISVLNCKIRVMDERLLLLSRFFLRVDDVLIRVIDTRIYVEFDENIIIREFKKYEDQYSSVLSRHRLSHSYDPKAALRDSNWVVANSPLVTRECEILKF
ncbi:hypothetical protein TPHA_0B01420 [Tetrapisispora phaffii CBS 4417]|uniref:Type 2A phosphatase activator TIP41 n=1 Tax=Tetrapisispora phaffii (strain ATCC 24235 / CBS 4417 / NBRC 1672 / NRRL Y-8282 / UCD 70-5) TaxID=1071381 RepID=G8BP84_TETPH|nr:hypothetical protein TPHA_0B01420 [Tetrapisispora phaffii CBS 4417]CCE61815.1 hypothetical protein TPHA_0B01420 [Tetrapisispora phaffii CBS 4417]